jgi:hypothetical protein
MAFMNGSASPGTICAIEGAAAPATAVHTMLAELPAVAAWSFADPVADFFATPLWFVTIRRKGRHAEATSGFALITGWEALAEGIAEIGRSLLGGGRRRLLPAVVAELTYNISAARLAADAPLRLAEMDLPRAPVPA